MNGNPTKTFIHVYHNLIIRDLLKNIANRWKYKIEKIRLFSVEGVEYEIGDLKYINDKESLYVSKGEDFASN